MSSYRAMVLGGTGAIGRHVVHELVRSQRCQSITAVVRRAGTPDDLFGISSDKIRIAQVDFEHLDPADFRDHDVAFSCLGTTRRQAGSAAAFERVDLDYVVETARLLAQAGTTQMLMVTAANANASSWFLYPRTKGLAEQRVADLHFRRLVVLRPALLVRDQSDRVVERLALWLTPASVQVRVEQVAKAMVKLAEQFKDEPAEESTCQVEYIDHATITNIGSDSAL